MATCWLLSTCFKNWFLSEWRRRRLVAISSSRHGPLLDPQFFTLNVDFLRCLNSQANLTPVNPDDRHGYAYRPKAKLIRDGSTHYLEVEGMDDMVEVERA
jgi:hypothetical protein